MSRQKSVTHLKLNLGKLFQISPLSTRLPKDRIESIKNWSPAILLNVEKDIPYVDLIENYMDIGRHDASGAIGIQFFLNDQTLWTYITLEEIKFIDK